MLENFLSFLAIFTLSSAARPFTLILQNKGKNEGEEANAKSHKGTMLPNIFNHRQEGELGHFALGLILWRAPLSVV